MKFPLVFLLQSEANLNIISGIPEPVFDPMRSVEVAHFLDSPAVHNWVECSVQCHTLHKHQVPPVIVHVIVIEEDLLALVTDYEHFHHEENVVNEDRNVENYVHSRD